MWRDNLYYWTKFMYYLCVLCVLYCHIEPSAFISFSIAVSSSKYYFSSIWRHITARFDVIYHSHQVYLGKLSKFDRKYCIWDGICASFSQKRPVEPSLSASESSYTKTKFRQSCPKIMTPIVFSPSFVEYLIQSLIFSLAPPPKSMLRY